MVISFFIVVLALALLDALALRYGADSRDGRDWQPTGSHPRW